MLCSSRWRVEIDIQMSYFRLEPSLMCMHRGSWFLLEKMKSISRKVTAASKGDVCGEE